MNRCVSMSCSAHQLHLNWCLLQLFVVSFSEFGASVAPLQDLSLISKLAEVGGVFFNKLKM